MPEKSRFLSALHPFNVKPIEGIICAICQLVLSEYQLDEHLQSHLKISPSSQKHRKPQKLYLTSSVLLHLHQALGSASDLSVSKTTEIQLPRIENYRCKPLNFMNSKDCSLSSSLAAKNAEYQLERNLKNLEKNWEKMMKNEETLHLDVGALSDGERNRQGFSLEKVEPTLLFQRIELPQQSIRISPKTGFSIYKTQKPLPKYHESIVQKKDLFPSQETSPDASRIAYLQELENKPSNKQLQINFSVNKPSSIALSAHSSLGSLHFSKQPSHPLYSFNPNYAELPLDSQVSAGSIHQNNKLQPNNKWNVMSNVCPGCGGFYCKICKSSIPPQFRQARAPSEQNLAHCFCLPQIESTLTCHRTMD